MLALLSLVAFPALVILAGVGDVITRRIPNWLSLLIAGLFFVFAVLTGMPGNLILWHSITGVALLAIGFGLFAAGVFGGGDAKLMAAAGFWIGWPLALKFVFYTAFAGGLVALAVALWAGFQMDQEIRGHSWAERWKKQKMDVPYGLALAAGAVLVFPESWWWKLAS